MNSKNEGRPKNWVEKLERARYQKKKQTNTVDAQPPKKVDVNRREWKKH